MEASPNSTMESPMQQKQSPRKVEFGSGSVSPSDGNLFGAFPLQNMGGNLGGLPPHRRASSVSFPVDNHPHPPQHKGEVSPTTQHLTSPSNHGHAHNPYRVARDAFYHHFEVDPKKSGSDIHSPNKGGRDASGAGTEVVRCHQLATAALALSYLIADLQHTKGKFPTARVTHEDIIVALKLPMSYLQHSHLTFHELHSIISNFMKQDERFYDYEVKATSFDTKLAEMIGAMTLIEEETSRRTSVLTANELRSTISDDGLSFDRVKIACFDSEIVSAENVIEVDETELEDDELLSNVIGDGIRTVGEVKDELRRRPGTHSGCAVVADIHRTLNSIQLLPIVSVEPLRTKRLDVPLKTLLDALSFRNPDSQRAQGIIEIRKKGATVDKSPEGMMGISLGLPEGPTRFLMSEGTDDNDPSNVDNIFGNDWANEVSWTSSCTLPLQHYDFTIAGHLLCTATALHLLHTERFPTIDVNAIISDLKLPATEILLGRTVHCQQWFGMVQALGTTRKLHVEYVPFVRQVKKPGAAPFVSVGALCNIIRAVVNQTPQEKCRRAVLMVTFHGNKARQAINYVSAGENPISYAIVAGYNEEAQSVLLVDCDVKRNELHWVCSVDMLHTAMVDYGCILIVDETASDTKGIVSQIIPELDAFTATIARVPAYVPVDKINLGAAEGLSSGTPIALCALAAGRLGVDATLDDFLRDPPCNVSHVLFPHISLFDLGRLFNCFSTRRGLNLFATVTSLATDRAMHRKISLPSFASTLKGLLDDGQQVIVYFSRHQLIQAPWADGMICPNYALVLSMPNQDTVMLVDTNPASENRKYEVTTADLHKACEDVCPVSRRPKGYLVISKNEAECSKRARAIIGYGDLHFKTPSCHAFRSVGSPQLQALAMSFTAFGHVTRAAEIFYAVLNSGDDTLSNTLLPMSGLRRRLTIPTLAKIGNLYSKIVLGGAIEVAEITGSSRNGQVTRDDVKTVLANAVLATVALSADSKPKTVLACVYDVRNAYDVPLEFMSAGVVAGFDDATGEVVVHDAEPSSWGELWRATLEIAAECLVREPDDADRERFGLIQLSSRT